LVTPIYPKKVAFELNVFKIFVKTVEERAESR